MESDTRGHQGFTLVELSIVLIIIGLLVAGVVSRKGLIEAANKQAFVKGLETYKTAIRSFELKYGELPGDISDAYQYWGADCNATDTNCNGDGDGNITASGGPNANEAFRAWQHLYLAGMVKREYTGTGYGTGNEAMVGLNVPVVPLRDDLGVMIASMSLYGVSNPVRSAFVIGSNYTNGRLNLGLTAPEAYFYDKKFDDGKPLQGLIRGYHPLWGTPNCRNANNVNADYSLTRLTQEECTLYWQY